MWKREGEQNKKEKKKNQHPEDVTARSWISDHVRWLPLVLNKTVLSNTSGCAAKGTARLPDSDTPCVSPISSIWKRKKKVHAQYYLQEENKPKSFISKAEMLWFCQAAPAATAMMECPTKAMFVVVHLGPSTNFWQKKYNVQALPCYRDLNLDATASFIRSNSLETWLGRKIMLENMLHFVHCFCYWKSTRTSATKTTICSCLSNKVLAVKIKH